MGRIERVILTASGEMYEQFMTPVALAWMTLFNADVSRLPTMVIRNIPQCNVAKVLRWIAACEFTDEYVLITDVDMLPLNVDYFNECASHAQPDKILFFTSELEGEDKGKYPACYTLAKGSTFARYINPDNLNVRDLIRSWDFGPMANPSQLPFSDESLTKFLFKDAPKICLERHHQYRRLCRSNWRPDAEKLAQHWYIDCHMLRPFSENRDELRPVFQSIGIKI